MKKPSCRQIYQSFTDIHTNTLKQLDPLTEADLDYRPAPAMRTARELLFHMLSMEAEAAHAVKAGNW